MGLPSYGLASFLLGRRAGGIGLEDERIYLDRPCGTKELGDGFLEFGFLAFPIVTHYKQTRNINCMPHRCDRVLRTRGKTYSLCELPKGASQEEVLAL